MTSWPEISESELRRLIHTEHTELPVKLAVYFYTPMCGTCAVGSRMLDVIYAMEPRYPIVKANLNAMPALAQDWQIESVPCLILWNQGTMIAKEYAMRSVEHLLAVLLPFRPPAKNGRGS